MEGSRKYLIALPFDGCSYSSQKTKSGEYLPASCSAHGFLHLSKVVETGSVT